MERDRETDLDQKLDEWLDSARAAEPRAEPEPARFLARLRARIESEGASTDQRRRRLSRASVLALAALALVAVTLTVTEWPRSAPESPELTRSEEPTPTPRPELLDELDVLIELDSASVAAVVEDGPEALEVGEQLELLQHDEVDEVLALLVENDR